MIKLFTRIKEFLAPQPRQTYTYPQSIEREKKTSLESIDATLKEIRDILQNRPIATVNNTHVTKEETDRLQGSGYIPRVDTDGLRVASDRTTKKKTVKRNFNAISEKLKEND